MKPSDVARKTFTLVRRGFDPQEVGAYLESVASHIASIDQRLLERESEIVRLTEQVEDARRTEEAVRLTMVAATKTKEELVTAAEEHAAQVKREAISEADQLRRAARDEAERLIATARAEALELLNSSHQDARDLVAAAREENNELVRRIEVLRTTVRSTRDALARLTEEGLSTLDTLTAEVESAAPLEILPPLEPPEEFDRRGRSESLEAIRLDHERLETASEQIRGLPDDVDPDIRSRIAEELRRLGAER